MAKKTQVEKRVDRSPALSSIVREVSVVSQLFKRVGLITDRNRMTSLWAFLPIDKGSFQVGTPDRRNDPLQGCQYESIE